MTKEFVDENGRTVIILVSQRVEEPMGTEKVKVVFGEARSLLDSEVVVYPNEVTVEGWMAIGDPDDERVKEFMDSIEGIHKDLWGAVGRVLDEVEEEWKNFVHEQKSGEESKYPTKTSLSKDEARIDDRGAGMMMRLSGGMTWGGGWKLDREEGLELVRMIQEGTKVPKHRVTWEGR